MTALQPIPIRVVRHACPHCGRTHSRPGRAREHMARCWRNPEARGCKTSCAHFEPYGPEWGDSCGRGIDLTGPIVGCDHWQAAPRCQDPACPDFGDPDFGEGTCPAEHADPRPAEPAP